MRLGVGHQIVDDLDSKPSKFEQQIYNGSKSDVEIGFQLNDGFEI